MARLDEVIQRAEAKGNRKQARDALLAGIVDMAVERGRTMSTILNDPVIAEFFADHDAFRDAMNRLRRLLIGDDSGPEARVRTAMLIAAISGAVMHPLIVDLDDETLRVELLRLARRFLGLPA